MDFDSVDWCLLAVFITDFHSPRHLGFANENSHYLNRTSKLTSVTLGTPRIRTHFKNSLVFELGNEIQLRVEIGFKDTQSRSKACVLNY